MPMPSMNNARVRVCVDGLRCWADPTASTSPLRPRTCPPPACRVPARTNGRPLETAAPNALICLPERPEQVPLAARQIGGSRSPRDRGVSPRSTARQQQKLCPAAETARQSRSSRCPLPGSARDISSDDIGSVPVEAAAGSCPRTFGLMMAASLTVRMQAREKPRRWVPAGLWCSCCRLGGQSVVTSVTAARAEDSSTMALRSA